MPRHALLASRPRPLRRLPMTPAAGTLALAAVAPAIASDTLGDDDEPGWSRQGGNGGGDWGNGDNGGGGNSGGGNGNHGDHGRHKGAITAPSLALRTSPDRGSRVIRYARKGDVVSIHRKVGGDGVQGNPPWYLVTDGGTRARGAARHVDNIGPAPRWC
ncbi:SH3 domain-containing protein [Streptomyces incanus]|uniref:SH3 domain-containing protein n=1 Tax=Streptomyces incanus TaxID=887453 RepID=A0ABW0XN76_9ACTN